MFSRGRLRDSGKYNQTALSIRNFPQLQLLPNGISPGAQHMKQTKAEMLYFILLTLNLISVEEHFSFLKNKTKLFLQIWAPSYPQVCVFNSCLIESSPLVIFGTGFLHVHKVTSDRSPSRVDRRLPLQNQGAFPDFTTLETVWGSCERERDQCIKIMM